MILLDQCQFMEMDGNFKEQQTKIDAFPLPPSIIVKTRKSLHCYWLMKEAEVSGFMNTASLVKQFTVTYVSSKPCFAFAGILSQARACYGGVLSLNRTPNTHKTTYGGTSQTHS